MRFEHEESRYGRYSRVPKAQLGRLAIYVVVLVAVIVAMYALATQREKPVAIEWLPSFEKALAQAKAAGKPIMAFFFVEGNAACRRMDDETFADTVVRAEAQKFVCVRLDGKAHPDLVERYLIVEAYPSVAFISSDGGLVRTSYNHWPPEKFLGEMRAALQPRELSPTPSEPSQGDAE